jgi:glycine rich protein
MAGRRNPSPALARRTLRFLLAQVASAAANRMGGERGAHRSGRVRLRFLREGDRRGGRPCRPAQPAQGRCPRARPQPRRGPARRLFRQAHAARRSGHRAAAMMSSGRRMGSRRAKKVWTFLGMTGLSALLGGTVVYASIPESSGVIDGCYLNTAGGILPPGIRRSQGTLRVVDPSKGQACDPNETALSWNQVGQQGPLGEQGPAGPQGPTGPGVSVFRSSGMFDAPPTVSRVLVEVWGGGGGGGVGFGNNAGGGGGGQGGYVRALVPVLPGSVYRLTVGPGGAGGTDASLDAVNGTPGETSVFASTDGTPLVAAAGGNGGNTVVGLGACANPSGGAGGAGSVNSSLQVTGTTLQVGTPGGAGNPWPFCIPNAGSGAGGGGGGPAGFVGAGGAGGDVAQPSAPGLSGASGMISITPLT